MQWDFMARGKYNRDYRLIEEFQENGRIRMGTEYIGDAWFFTSGAETVKRETKTALVLLILAAAAFVIALIPRTGMMHKLWIALPFAVTAVPLFLMGDLLFSLRGFKEPMERRNADKVNNQFPARALAIAYLSLVSLITETVYLVLYGAALSGDIVMTACTAVIFWCALMLFRKRARFHAEVKKT